MLSTTVEPTVGAPVATTATTTITIVPTVEDITTVRESIHTAVDTVVTVALATLTIMATTRDTTTIGTPAIQEWSAFRMEDIRRTEISTKQMMRGRQHTQKQQQH